MIRAEGTQPAGHASPAGLAAAAGDPGPRDTSARDIAALLFTGEMYGVQLDQLTARLGLSARRTAQIAARWAASGQAEIGRLGPGPRWIWLTRAGLADCGLPYAAAAPALSRLAHIRAVTAARLALEAVPGYAAGGAYWRSERRLRARLGGRLGQRDHLPDAEIHWPDEPARPGESGPGEPGPGEPGPAPPWAGECWAIEAELTPKTVSRTTAIMRELLTRTGDYGAPAGEASVPGQPARHARVIYLCGPAALRTVVRARAALSRPDAARIEIRALPPAAAMPGAAAPAAATPAAATPTGPAPR